MKTPINPYDEQAPGYAGKSTGPSAELRAFWAAEEAIHGKIREWAKAQIAAGRAKYWNRNDADGTEIDPDLAAEMATLCQRCVALLTPTATAAGKLSGLAADKERVISEAIRLSALWVWEDHAHRYNPARKSPRWF